MLGRVQERCFGGKCSSVQKDKVKKGEVNQVVEEGT